MVSFPRFYQFLSVFCLSCLFSSCSWLRVSPQCAEPCGGYNFIWSSKVDCEFKQEVHSISKSLWPNDAHAMSNNLMAIIALESAGTFSTGVPNARNSGATGLIQIMPRTYTHLTGKTPQIEYVDYWGTGKKYKRVKQLARMSDVEYLNLTKKYFHPLKGKDVDFVDLYLQVLLPVSAGKPDHAVFADSHHKLTLKNESKRIRKLRVNHYQKNDGFDLDGDGRTMKSEIAQTIEKYRRNGRDNMCRA